MTTTVKSGFTYITLVGHHDVFFKSGFRDYFAEVTSIGISTLNALGRCAPLK